MSKYTKRKIRRVVEEARPHSDTRTELVSGAAIWWGEEPELTESLTQRGFVVERELRHCENGHEDILLHPKPDAVEVHHSATWHRAGPTTPKEALRVDWDQDALDAAKSTAEHPIEFSQPDLPDDPVTILDGDGWQVVAPAEVTAEHMVGRRSKAKREGLEILGDAPPVQKREEYDLVEINADPVEYSKR